MKKPVAERIVLVESDLAIGGEPSVTVSLAHHLKSKGREVMVLCAGGAGVEQLRSRGIPTLIYAQAQRPWAFWLRKPIESGLLSFRPDLLHARTHSLARFVKSLATGLKCPYVVTVNRHIAHARELPHDKALLRRIIAVSDPLREALVNTVRIPKDIIRLVPHGVNTAGFRPLRKDRLDRSHGLDAQDGKAEGDGKPLWNGKTPVIGMIAPMQKEKGNEFFLRAAKAVLDEKPDVQFLVAGKGPETVRCRKLAVKLGLTQSLTFVDYLDNHALLLSAMDVFVLPTVEEGYGVTILEAMAAGRPVVASGVGGLYSIVRDRETGLIVPRQDANALARALLELLNQPQLAHDLAQQAMAMVENEFDQETLFERLLQIYDEAAAVSPKATGRA
jgi:glycosyltransferase involved in cell wall biosynthesis